MSLAVSLLLLIGAASPGDADFERSRAAARAAMKAGDLQQAGALLRRAIDACAQADPSGRRCIDLVLDQADLGKRIGLPQDSERAARHALSILERNGIGASAHRFEALNFIAMALEDRGDPAAAEAYHRRAGDILRALKPRNPDLEALHYANLASNLGFRGRHAEAEALHRTALEMEQQRTRPNDRAIATTMTNLAQSLMAQGKFALAEPYLHDALRKNLARLSPNDPELARTYNALAEIRRNQRRYREAGDDYLKALTILERFGEHPGLIPILGNIGLMLNRQNIDGERYFRRAYALARRVQGADGTLVAKAAEALAYNQGVKGSRDEARALLIEAYRIRSLRLGTEDQERIWGAWWLGLTSEVWDRNPAQARALFREATDGAHARIATHRDYSVEAQGEARNFAELFRARVRVSWQLADRTQRP
ncbi:tetratricopeptide repeat protein [Sphingomonas sp. R647]|uniref:tetratricopeptide repeat protein n=1 Tax=Sphingomonas sp. R647 TaxID=2875233 RepID=UPI001CD47040|nr:tetratricopeptide repeat protein [Sphingomonas sp. R647]MCA1199910.1 tetratricopeptide repeat protein [Sphingomonas sp. R647]